MPSSFNVGLLIMTTSSSPGMTAKENGSRVTKPQLVCSAIRTGHVVWSAASTRPSATLSFPRCDMPPTSGHAACSLFAIPTDMVVIPDPSRTWQQHPQLSYQQPRVPTSWLDTTFHARRRPRLQHRNQTYLGVASTPLNAGTYGPDSPGPKTSGALIDASSIAGDGDG